MHRIPWTMDSQESKRGRPDSEEAVESASDLGFAVRDRRWWVEAEAGEGEQPAPDAGEAEAPKPTFVAELEKQLEELRRVADEARSRQRAAIEEFDRAKQRIERDAAREQEARHRGVLASFLPVVDDLDRALAAAGDGADAQAIIDGVALVRKTLLAKLEEHGVTRMDAQGAVFDPSVHEAVATLPVEESSQNGRVIAIHREGYALGETVIRAPLVVVGKA